MRLLYVARIGVDEGDLLWTPGAERIQLANVTHFRRWLGDRDIADLPDIEALWRWSVRDLGAFWDAIRAFGGVHFGSEPACVLAQERMPGAVWFPQATLNYAAEALRHPSEHIAVVHRDESGAEEWTYGELSEAVRRCAAGLRRLGVGRGDRVAAYAPNQPQAIVAFLATTSLGAIWTACSPDFGVRSVLDRLDQVQPVVLFAVTSYRYGGKDHDRSADLSELVAGIVSLRALVSLDDGSLTIPSGCKRLEWAELLAPTTEPISFEEVPFDHPLWVVYTSGTTGLPKSIVHGHGGIVLEHHKLLRLHLDLHEQDRFFWFTTTGWVMWNIVVGSLLLGATAVTFDGNPTYPSLDRLWSVIADTGATFAGMSAGYVHACLRDDLRPRDTHDLSQVRSVGVTGSPLSPAGNAWLYDNIDDDLFVASISGGTDVGTAFVGSLPVLPVRAGHLQHACLGTAATAYDESGEEVVGAVGELVITRPTPSMPIGFWGDDDNARYQSSYFDMWPGVWRHGDWVRFDDDGSCVVLGRSDATLNRGGVRMGSAEFYAVLETIDEVADSLVIDTSASSDGGELVLLVVAVSGSVDDHLRSRIRSALRTALSPRHVPDHILGVPALPHTLNGKRLEVPVRRMFLGADMGIGIDSSAIDDPAALAAVVALAGRWNAGLASVLADRP